MTDGLHQTLEVCRLDEIEPGTSRGFSLAGEAGVIDLFLVRMADEVYAYLNSCPHTGGPLDWVPDQFLNLEGDLIQCATHDALFQIETGSCIRGPCAGQSLTALPVSVTSGRVSVTV